MTPAPHPLYELLPAYVRTRDAETGHALRALVTLMGEQFDVIESDIAQHYANWFIETCADWAVPYIGDLVGYQPVAATGRPRAGDGTEARMPNAAITPRAEIANILAFRRRKGTLALLEEIADAVTGWPARAVEFYTLLARTQHVAFPRSDRGRTVDLRQCDALDRLGGPFDTLAHGVDVRRAVGVRRHGRCNIPAVGLFAWRLHVHSVTHAPAKLLEGEGDECFTFSIHGNDAPLFIAAAPEASPAAIAGEANLPGPIRRRALEHRVSRHPPVSDADPALYGEGRSLAIYAPGWPTRTAPQPVPATNIVCADLSDWGRRARRNAILVDPERGRIVFPVRQLPKAGVWVDYHHGFPADMGGGEYHRPLSQPADVTLYRVSATATGPDISATIPAALARWRADPAKPRAAIVEIDDSDAYTDALAITLSAGEYLQVRAADRMRPVIRLLDYSVQRADAFTVSGASGSRFVLDGIVVTGRGLKIVGPDPAEPELFAQGDLCDVVIRHSTLVPGWTLDCDCKPGRPSEPSVELIDCTARLRVSHSIIGAIHVVADEVRADPTEIEISDSIVDSTGDQRPAIAAPNLPLAFAYATFRRCTVFGSVQVHAITLAENSIFTQPLRVARRQIGCIRYCYVAPGSRTPRRSNCQPDLVSTVPGADAALESARVEPHFTARRLGNPAYAQLAATCAPEITRGADDEAEMGAFHDLFQPQRAANLAARLVEYSPTTTEADVIFAN